MLEAARRARAPDGSPLRIRVSESRPSHPSCLRVIRIMSESCPSHVRICIWVFPSHIRVPSDPVPRLHRGALRAASRSSVHPVRARARDERESEWRERERAARESARREGPSESVFGTFESILEGPGMWIGVRADSSESSSKSLIRHPAPTSESAIRVGCPSRRWGCTRGRPTLGWWGSSAPSTPSWATPSTSV